MDIVIDKPLSLRERLEKAKTLLEEGKTEYLKAEKIEEEFKARKLASCSCEKIFHSFVELTNGVLMKHNIIPPETHDERWEKLREIGRSDLASMYSEAKDALHTSCYYNQRVGPRQKIVIQQVTQKIEEEISKF